MACDSLLSMQKEELLKILNDFQEELQTYSEQLELHNEMETVLRQAHAWLRKVA